MQTFVELVRKLKFPPFGGYWAQRYLGVIALQFDALAEAMTQAVAIARISRLDRHPDDALDALGKECRIPRAPTETAAHYRSRLQRKWKIWAMAGSDEMLLETLNASGLGATAVIIGRDIGLTGKDESGVWVLFPHNDSAPETIGGLIIGTDKIGESYITWGPASQHGADVIQYFRDVLERFLPIEFQIRGYLVQGTAGFIGIDFKVGESVINGTYQRIDF